VRDLDQVSALSTPHDFLQSPDLVILTNTQNSHVVTVMRSGSTRLAKLWDAASGRQLWESMQEYTRDRQSNLPDFSPEGNYVGFDNGGSAVTILNIATNPIQISREIDFGTVYGEYKRFALGNMGRDISILKARPSSSPKHRKFDTRGGCIHVFETPGDIFGTDDDRRNLRYNKDGTRLILIRLSKPFYSRHPHLIVDIYEFASDRWQTSRRFNMTESVHDITLLSGGLVSFDSESFLALEYRTGSIRKKNGIQLPWREERVVLEVALEGAIEIRCAPCTHHDAFLSGGCLVMIGQPVGNEGGTHVRVWESTSKDAPPTTFSATINYSTRYYKAVAFNSRQLTLLSTDKTLVVVNVDPVN
jgi:hypothetical protein